MDLFSIYSLVLKQYLRRGINRLGARFHGKAGAVLYQSRRAAEDRLSYVLRSRGVEVPMEDSQKRLSEGVGDFGGRK